jgi:hypothetical protein
MQNIGNETLFPAIGPKIYRHRVPRVVEAFTRLLSFRQERREHSRTEPVAPTTVHVDLSNVVLDAIPRVASASLSVVRVCADMRYPG